MQAKPDVPFEVRVEPAGWCFPARPGESLREAAAAAGIVLPTSCRNGTCRACLVRLAAGTVAYRVDWPGLSAEEKATGWTLPCVALARSDLVIEQPAALRDTGSRE
jgi:ferredoxin